MAAWGKTEIEMLRAEIESQKADRINWRHVAIAVGGGRTPEQCRSKWRRINGTAKPRAWAVHERSLLRYVVEEQEKLGIDWSSIKDFFYGRTATQCQIEWARIQAKASPKKAKLWEFDELSALMEEGVSSTKINRSESAKRGMLFRMRKNGWATDV